MNVDETMLFFDLETIPDLSRREKLESWMDPLPDKPPKPMANEVCKPVAEIASQSVPIIEKYLLTNFPDAAWTESLIAKENDRPKPRSGVADAIRKYRNILDGVDYKKAVESRNKLLSVTPEFCAICAFSYAIGSGDIQCETAYDTKSEILLLQKFWHLASYEGRLCGYNVLSFDLPVIFARSIILGVEQQRRISGSVYNNPDVLDLYVKRYSASGKPAAGVGQLKNLASAYGIEIPAEGMEGSQVFALFQAEQPNFKKLIEYAKSDVQITRELYLKGQAFFWD